jgi:Glyoxalase/Bleomycin resistance protein/Dioxygenase superfamily
MARADQSSRAIISAGILPAGCLMLQKLFHVNICVRDMERSIRFYQDLGFTKMKDFHP